MSLSRQLARATDEEFREAMAVFANKCDTRGHFIATFRPVLRAMHRGGADTQRLTQLKKLALQEWKARKGADRDMLINIEAGRSLTVREQSPLKKEVESGNR
jgi:hypothetical protein